jgi:tetratricopeptide (TPR) repeat protein
MGVALIRELVASAGDACDAGRCPEAIDALEAAVRKYPGNYRLHYLLGLCHSGICRTHALCDTGIAIRYQRHALELLGPENGPERATVLEALASTLARLGEPGALRESIEFHREAGAIYRQAGQMEDWARLQFNLGNSCCELSELTGENHWHTAVGYYENALQVRTRQKNPERHAAVLENLGSAWRRLDVKRAILCYRRALRIYNRIDYPAQNAAIENNLGNAFLSLPRTGRRTVVRNAMRALRHFDRALQGCDSEVIRRNREEARSRLAKKN